MHLTVLLLPTIRHFVSYTSRIPQQTHAEKKNEIKNRKGKMVNGTFVKDEQN